VTNTTMAEHPLLTKDRDTGVKGHHHTTEHVELHHHLRLDIEGEEKSQNLPHYHRHARQALCVQLSHHLDVVDRQDYQQERVCRQQGHVWEELRTYLKK